MDVSTIAGSGLQDFTRSMRLFVRDPFGAVPAVQEGTSGRFNITDRKLQFFHNKGEREPTKNHVILNKKPGNRFLAKVDVAAKFGGVTRTAVGMVLKKQDDKNYYAVEIGSDQKARFFEFKDGNRSTLRVKKLDEKLGNEFNMAVDVQGANMKFMLDGEEVFSVRDSTHSGGDFGFGGFSTPTTFTNLEVYK